MKEFLRLKRFLIQEQFPIRKRFQRSKRFSKRLQISRRGGAVAAIAFGIFLPGIAAAQKPYFEIGIDPAAVLTHPLGTLESIRGSAPCSRQISAATRANVGLSASVAYVLNGWDYTPGGIYLRAFRFAVGLDNLSSAFQSSPEEEYDGFDPVNGAYRVIDTRQSVEYSMKYIRADAEAELALGKGLRLRGGPTLSIPLSASVRESEAILSPSNATFLDRTQEREIAEGTGAISDAKMRLGVAATFAYRLPIGRKLFIEPNIGADIGITSVQPGWSPLEIRGGISIAYALVSTSVPIDDDVVDDTPPEIPKPKVPRPTEKTPREIPFTARLGIGVTAGKFPIELRRQIVAHYVPMLPVIFFDQNSPEISARYAQLNRDANAAPAFHEENLPGDAEKAHAQTLNVYGKRLRENPRATVTIVGTTSQDEANRASLAENRAENVARYLENVWGIEKKRISVHSRLDPAVPSSSETPEGRQENRRVELDINQDGMYQPIQLRAVEPTTEPREIPFTISSEVSSGAIDRWRVEIIGRDSAFGGISGNGAPPSGISWPLTQNDRERVLNQRDVHYRLSVYDSAGRAVSTPAQSLPLLLDTTVTIASSPNQPDNTADFLLVTFDFDRAELTRRGREELHSIFGRIGPNSRVSIVGYTDPIGNTEHNRALAADRARRVASMMPAGTNVEARGAAPEEAPYSSASPEGRFLSRTVRVVVTNPK